ncbi:TPA: hypothetical protein HA242_07495 [Candidatus Woesearchaeota archaeon]|nr:hypothetical protein [Candidatus Woesearchaeota archaeon]
MKCFMEKHHFEQAKLWLEGAKYIASCATEDNNKYAVAVAMAVHSIIKANDTLTYKYLQEVAKRHDEAPKLFEEAIKRHGLDGKSSYKHIIYEAIGNKAKAEYRGAFFSKNDFESIRRNAEKFIKMIEELV